MCILKMNFFLYHTILLNEMNAVQKVWRITDLVRLIGLFKHDFEHNMDIEQINNTYLFQHLIPLIFFIRSDSGVVKYNAKNDDRMRIEICKCNPQITVIQFDLFHKHKRTQYYHDSIFLDNDKEPLVNQRRLSECILNDSLLLGFFKADGEVV